MKRSTFLHLGLGSAALALTGCATPGGAAWTTLIDGSKGLDNFNRIGDANWRAEGDAIVADQGRGGYLVTKQAYADFEMRVEFWAATNTNSGVFIRCQNPANVGADNAYEVNIWDIRPDPKYGTAGIVNVATVPVPPVFLAGGKWNTFDILAKGDQLVVRFNGVQAVHVRDGAFARGPVALQFGAGVNGALGGPIKWRRAEIRAI
jgi:hypothetical protein